MAEKNRQWILVKRPEGPLTDDCFELRESAVPAPKAGEFVVRNQLLSCDPTQRAWIEVDTYLPKIPLGEVVRGAAGGTVVASNHPGFQVGDVVQGGFGWQEYCVTDGKGPLGAIKLPPAVPLETALSLFGITGLTAYFGMVDVAGVKAGDTVAVSGAAGSTGSLAAQIAKNLDAHVIGIAGGAKKKAWLLDELKLDGAIDYKNEDVGARLKQLAPKRLNVYDRAMEAVGKLVEWSQAGKLVNAVNVAEGLEHTPKAFRNLFTGGNIGKQLVRIA